MEMEERDGKKKKKKKSGQAGELVSYRLGLVWIDSHPP
jgi:hypothetical protein